MDFYTKVFLINMFILLVMANLDRQFFNDGLENGKYTKDLFALWVVGSVFSIPVWVVYFIIIW